MAADDHAAFRRAVVDFHERVSTDPLCSAALTHAAMEHALAEDAANGTVAHSLHEERLSAAIEHLIACLEDQRLPDGLIDDVLSVVDTVATMCGLPPPPDAATTSGPLRAERLSTLPNPAKLKLLRGATGLPVHTTSIGRRASASYCVYESMGGWETLSAAVESLYNRMRNDPRSASLFAPGSEQQLKTHMLEFLTCALGGKARLSSSTLLTSQRDQLRAHGFGAPHLDVMIGHMQSVLDDLGVHSETAVSAISLLRCYKDLFERRLSEAGDENGGHVKSNGTLHSGSL